MSQEIIDKIEEEVIDKTSVKPDVLGDVMLLINSEVDGKADLTGAFFTGNLTTPSLTVSGDGEGNPAQIIIGATTISDNSSTGPLEIGLPTSSGQLALTSQLDGKANLSGATFTGAVTAPTFNGALNGNANTATSPSNASTFKTALATSLQDVTSVDPSTSQLFITDGVGNWQTKKTLYFEATEGVARINGYDFSVGSPTPLSLQNLGGNVGIGTTSPTEKLHVVGKAIVTGTPTNPNDVVRLSDTYAENEAATPPSASDLTTAYGTKPNGFRVFYPALDMQFTKRTSGWYRTDTILVT